MKIEVTISKWNLIILVLSMSIIFSLILAYAYSSAPGSVPNPGHGLDSVQGYFSGDANLQISLAKFCQSDGTNCPSAAGGPISGGDYGYCVYSEYRGDGISMDECGAGISSASYPAPTSPAYCTTPAQGSNCACQSGYTLKLSSHSYREVPKDGGNPYGETTYITSCLKN